MIPEDFNLESALADVDTYIGSDDVTPDGLDERELALMEAINTAKEDGDLETVRKAVPAVQKIQARRGEMEAEAEAAAAEMAELLATVTPEEPEASDDDEPEAEAVEEPEAEAADEPQAEAADEPEPAEAEAEEPVLVAAKVETIRPRAATMRRPAQAAVEAMNDAKFMASNMPEFPEGTPITDMEQFGTAVANKIERMRRQGQLSGPVTLGRVEVAYPDDRTLTADEHSNKRKVDAVVASAKQTANDVEALVASGGLCAPVNVRYDLFGIGDARRPIRDGMVRFNANRGGIRFVAPPELADVTVDTDGTYDSGDDTAIVQWTEAIDTTPGSNVKPCQTITCGDDTEEVIDAITQCLQVGNFQKRTFAENFARWWELATIAHARTAETLLWDAAVGDSTAVTTGQLFGFTRDFFENLDQAAAQYRSRHRMGRNDTLEVIVPDWVPQQIRSDLLRQGPGDSTYAVTDGQIASWFATRNISVIYTPDTDQEFGAQPAGALLANPSNVEVLMYAPGTHLFLDGGTLDFGMEIRDTTLNETNDVQAFMETFEGHAFIGVESVHLDMAVCASGKHQLGDDVDTCATAS